MGPQEGDTWTVRIFRDPSCELRVFRIYSMRNLGIGVIDVNDSNNRTDREKILWFAKSDLQFLDLIFRPVTAEAGAGSGSEEAGQNKEAVPGTDRSANSAARSGGQPRHDDGVREKRNR